MMPLDDLLRELGYSGSDFYRESGEEADSLSVAHLLRDATERAGVRGTYFIRTTGEEAGGRHDRPAVYVAEADTPEDARRIHRLLWNQGATPFLLVSLPGQVRVYTPFAYDQSNKRIGQVGEPLDTGLGIRDVVEHLSFLRADSIDSGEIWRTAGCYLTKDRRVGRILLDNLRALSDQLAKKHKQRREVAHALVGRFVYLHYLRDRRILSDRWLADEKINPSAVFSSDVSLSAFQHLSDAVDARFNGNIFPINWSDSSAPNEAAVRAAGRAFAGEEDVATKQLLLFRAFDFSFIPIELLSAIYEQFLHDEGRGDREGAFYTSEPVADYLLAEVESVRPLKQGMKVLDPCCGSGIFLVLAFRRLVEQEMRRRQTDHLPPTALREILTSSIFGVERNPEACSVTEFSLILALLSYVDPPELHQHTKFTFPVLRNDQIFEADFFSDDSEFWVGDQRFDWIVGNPPWVRLDSGGEREQSAISWIQRSKKARPVALFRSSEAFTWRAAERLAGDGAVGLITQATSLTNDLSLAYRKAFFAQNRVRRVTNFANLAYDIFESAEEPAAVLVYSKQDAMLSDAAILHFGPFKAHQTTLGQHGRGRKGASWAITVCESEIQMVESCRAASGEGAVWKQALWGNARDRRLLDKLRVILPRTLGEIADKRGWTVCKGLELRTKKGTGNDAAVASAELNGIPVLEVTELQSSSFRFSIRPTWLKENQWGMFIRSRGGSEGLKLIPGPHLFVCKDFAAFGLDPCIFRGTQIGVAAPDRDSDWLRAVSVVWACSALRFYLFMCLSASWGIGRSKIYAADVRHLPFVDLNAGQLEVLSGLHRKLVEMESRGEPQSGLQQLVDGAVAELFKVPSQLMVVAREFFEFRLRLIKGKVPQSVSTRPDRPQLQSYATRLKRELDGFLERRSCRHAVTVLRSPDGIIATVELTGGNGATSAKVLDAGQTEAETVRGILHAAEKKHGQWAYVRRSVRVFSGKKIHICKPARRLEWTETQALLDAADVIAEVIESRGRKQ